MAQIRIEVHFKVNAKKVPQNYNCDNLPRAQELINKFATHKDVHSIFVWNLIERITRPGAYHDE